MEPKLYLYKVDCVIDGECFDNMKIIMPEPITSFEVSIQSPLTAFFDHKSKTLYINECYVHEGVRESFIEEVREEYPIVFNNVVMFNDTNYEEYYDPDMYVFKGAGILAFVDPKDYDKDHLYVFLMDTDSTGGEIINDYAGNLLVKSEVHHTDYYSSRVSYVINESEYYCPYHDGYISHLIDGYHSKIEVCRHEFIELITDPTIISIMWKNEWMYEYTPQEIERYVHMI